MIKKKNLKSKIKIEELKVKSFFTSLEKGHEKTVLGGDVGTGLNSVGCNYKTDNCSIGDVGHGC